MTSSRTISAAMLILAGVLACTAPFARAAEQNTVRFRLIGLFEPDRQDDLKDVLANIPEMQLVSLDYNTTLVTFRYDPAALFAEHPKKSPSDAEVLQRMNNLLNRESEGTFRLKPASDLPVEKLTKVQVPIGILDCKGCRYAAYNAIANVDGVERATVGKDNVVNAWINPAKVSLETIEAALKRVRVTLLNAHKHE